MGGIVGRLLHEFAVTIGVAILVSGFVSISLTPMLCSRFLKPPHATDARRRSTTRSSGSSQRGCGSTTGRCASRSGTAPSTMAFSIALLVGTVYLFTLVPKGFLPSEDQGRFMISTEARQGIGFDEMVRHQHEVADDRREGAGHLRASTT